ncbi:MAG: hypothetical protein AUJ97_00645 [Bacteroidetes bacterium CG2_30_32_10]|nr:MAG: hypothetical protein AUJ97_00645 [Bacteroidetes bacterium CG2_30_32_10]
MKNIIKISKLLLLTLVIAFSFFACSKIDEPYKKQQSVIIDTTGVLTGNTITDTIDKRVVLLEDYTGHTCVNCPKAHVKAHELLQKYGNQLVVLAVHQGTFAAPASSGDYTYDFRVLPTVDEWNAVWSITGYPAGLINRTKYNGSFVNAYGSWDGKIASIVTTSPEAIINVKNYYNTTTSNYTTRVNTKFNIALTGNYKLCVCIMEDSIIKPQKNSDPSIGSTPDIIDYVHMHVLRSVVNSTWGTTIGNASIKIGDTFNNSYTLTLKSDWKKDNLSIVAFVYDASDYHVLQAALAPLNNK